MCMFCSILKLHLNNLAKISYGNLQCPKFCDIAHLGQVLQEYRPTLPIDVVSDIDRNFHTTLQVYLLITLIINLIDGNLSFCCEGNLSSVG